MAALSWDLWQVLSKFCRLDGLGLNSMFYIILIEYVHLTAKYRDNRVAAFETARHSGPFPAEIIS